MVESLDNSNGNNISPVVDLTKLEAELSQLVQVLQVDQEQKKAEAEKLAKEEAAQKKIEEQQAKKDAENEKLTASQIAEKEAIQEEQTVSLMSFEEQQATTLEDLKVEMQKFNEQALILHDETINQNEIIVEGIVMVSFAVIFATAVKFFVQQISSW